MKSAQLRIVWFWSNFITRSERWPKIAFSKAQKWRQSPLDASLTKENHVWEAKEAKSFHPKSIATSSPRIHQEVARDWPLRSLNIDQKYCYGISLILIALGKHWRILKNECPLERSIRVLSLASNPKVLRPVVVELWPKAWGYSDPRKNPEEHQAFAQNDQNHPKHLRGPENLIVSLKQGQRSDPYTRGLQQHPNTKSTDWLKAPGSSSRMTSKEGQKLRNQGR